VLGVDLGSVRIGLARSDLGGTLASPVAVLARSGDPDTDHRAILAAAREAGASLIVVGVPRSLQGKLGRAARDVLREVAVLEIAARDAVITVETWDERFSTVVADRALRDAGSKGRHRDRIDAAAAAVILQSWLDARTCGST
jgi:putative Holliday junction resolvase